MASNTPNNLSLQSILKKDKLTGTHFLDWYRNLRMVFKYEQKLYVLKEPITEPPATNTPQVEKDAYKKHQDDTLDVKCLMLTTMNFKL